MLPGMPCWFVAAPEAACQSCMAHEPAYQYRTLVYTC